MKTLLARWSRFPRVSAKTRGDTAPFLFIFFLTRDNCLLNPGKIMGWQFSRFPWFD